MKMKYFRNALLAILLVGLFAGFTDIYFEINKNLELFSKVYREISTNYVDEIEPEHIRQIRINSPGRPDFSSDQNDDGVHEDATGNNLEGGHQRHT